MRRLLFLFLLLTAANGCTVGPDYKRPEVTVPNAFHYQPKKVAKTANTAWWKQFNDPVLDQLITEALTNNKDVKIAAANIEQAAGILTTTRSALFPQISYNATATRNRSSENQAIPEPSTNPFNNLQVLAGATWEIDLWGRIRRLSESARANLLASEEAKRSIILTLVAEVGASYIQLRALDNQLVISKNTLKSYKDSLNLFTLQHQYGQVSMLTVEQARSQYEAAATTIPQIEQQIVETEHALSILLGRNPGTIKRGRSLQELTMPAIPQSLPSELLVRRPDIVQAEQALIASNAQIGAAKAQYFPTISLTGAYGKSSEMLANLFRGANNSWNYGGSLTGPIFTAGAIRGQVAQATAATQAAIQNYQLTIQKAFADVENAFSSREKLTLRLHAEKKRVAAYKKYRYLAWHKYYNGYSPYLEVLFADTQLYPAELSAVQIKAATFISLINIYKAIGGGWISKAEKITYPDTSV